MATTTTAGFYVIKQDEDGNVLVFLPQPEGEKENPIIIYDGQEHALLVRSKEQNIILDYVNPDIRKELARVLAVTIIEVKGSEIVDNYIAGLRRVDSIPIDWKIYGLETWQGIIDKTKTASEG